MSAPRARPLFAVGLVVALAGLAAYVVVPPAIGRQHRAAIAEAERIATGLPEPAGATPLGRRDCNGDVLRRCFHVARDPDAVVAELATALARGSGRTPRQACETYTTPRGTAVRSCQVRVTTGRGHGVVLWADTRVRRDPADRTREVVSGSDVSYAAG